MRYTILTDESPVHPRRDEDGFGTILYTSSRYELGDEHVDGEEINQKMKDSSVIALPVYAYIHGGVMLNTTGFSCKFDSGQSGCIFISKDDVRRIFNVKRISPKLLANVLNSLKSEVDVYSKYLGGEVYGYRIFNDQGDEIESCWGFYGMEIAEKEAEEAMKQQAKYIPPSPKALAALEAGIASAKKNPPIFRSESFAQYANDE